MACYSSLRSSRRIAEKKDAWYVSRIFDEDFFSEMCKDVKRKTGNYVVTVVLFLNRLLIYLYQHIIHGFHNSTVRLKTRDYSKFSCLST